MLKHLAMKGNCTPLNHIGPLQNSQIPFSDKFQDSVPHRVRNKMRDLISKSYSIDIDKETIKSEQKSDPIFRDLYNFLKFKHISL